MADKSKKKQTPKERAERFMWKAGDLEVVTPADKAKKKSKPKKK